MIFQKFLSDLSSRIAFEYDLDPHVCLSDLKALLTEEGKENLTQKQLHHNHDIRKKIKDYRKKIYYSKRCYYEKKEHFSVRERKPFEKEWRQWLQKELEEAKTVLDLGCGLFPFFIPFSSLNLKRYDAIEKQKTSLNHLKSLQEPCFHLHSENLMASFPKVCMETQYDVIFALQLFPLLWRQFGPNFSQKFPALQGKQWILSHAHFSLVKQTPIRSREGKIMNKCLKALDLEPLESFTIGQETLIKARGV